MRDDGTLRPNGPRRKQPASRSSSMPKTLGESNDGTHSQSIAPSGATSAPVWQSDRNAYSAIGGEGEGGAALLSCCSSLPTGTYTQWPWGGPVAALTLPPPRGGGQRP